METKVNKFTICRKKIKYYWIFKFNTYIKKYKLNVNDFLLYKIMRLRDKLIILFLDRIEINIYIYINIYFFLSS